jgi:hypothetical protein
MTNTMNFEVTSIVAGQQWRVTEIDGWTRTWHVYSTKPGKYAIYSNGSHGAMMPKTAAMYTRIVEAIKNSESN